MLSRYYAGAVILITLSLGVGCGKTEGKLSGTVTYRGKPIENGEILFTGDEKRGHSSPGVVVQIKNGKFQTPSERGHWGGPYIASVTAYKGQTTIFADYEIQLDLPKGDTSIDIDVPDTAGMGVE